MQLLEENMGVNPRYLGFGNGFLDMASKVQTIKEKNSKLDLIKIKTFCALNGGIRR